MSGRKNDAGCVSIIAFLFILGFISTYWPIIIGIMVIIILFYLLYKIIINNKAKTQKNINVDKNMMGGFILESGKYIASRDIESGIYDLVVIRGFGFVETNVPEKIRIYLNEDDKEYKNLEISNNTVLKIDTGLSIRFYNKRNYTGQKPIESDMHKYVDANDCNISLIDNMDGWEFENFCADILGKIGYSNVNVTPGSGDQGVDITADRDGIKYAIQCKRFSQPVGNKAVQEIYAGKKFYHCHVGVIMTNNYFTSSAKELARENGIILWDRDFLSKFMNKNSVLRDDYEKYQAPYDSMLEKDNIVNHKPEEKDEKGMYDKEKGIYPPGHYLVGRDLPFGGYVLTARKDKNGSVELYSKYSDFKEDENGVIYENFDEDFFISLTEDKSYLIVNNADIQKV